MVGGSLCTYGNPSTRTHHAVLWSDQSQSRVTKKHRRKKQTRHVVRAISIQMNWVQCRVYLCVWDNPVPVGKESIVFCVLCGARVARLIGLFIIKFIAKLQSAPLITTTLWPIVRTQANAITFDLFQCDWELRWNVCAQLRPNLRTDVIILLRQCRRTYVHVFDAVTFRHQPILR